MARELGLNPKKLGKLDNADQEPWKLPLPLFIERLYCRRFGKTRPDVVMSIEERVRLQAGKKAAKRAAKQRAREAMPAAQRGLTDETAQQEPPEGREILERDDS